MKKSMIGIFLLTASSSLWAATTPAELPTSDDVSEAIAQVGAIQGAIDGLISTADGNSLENDRLARSILLKMSTDTNKIVDNLDELDHLLATHKYADALKKQKEVCSALVKLKADNKNAKTGADLPDVGNLSGGDSQFADVDSDIADTQKVLKCK